MYLINPLLSQQLPTPALPCCSTVFVTRSLMRRLAPVELLLKQTAVGGHEAAPSVLEGAVVRVLIDKVRGTVEARRWCRKEPVCRRCALQGIGAGACMHNARPRNFDSPAQLGAEMVRHSSAASPPQAYKLRQVQSTYIKPESQRLMLVLHVSQAALSRWLHFWQG